MITPIIAAIGRDALAQIPDDLREQGRALGLTDWEVAWGLLLPVAWRSVLAGIVLALGRALGETMAVVMVSGNAMNFLPRNLYSPVGTIAATILTQLDSALTDSTGMAIHALAELAVVLMILSLAVNLLVPVVAGGVRRVQLGRTPGEL